MKYDILIIGAGPGGYVAAIRAAQLGLKTALVEKKYIGGMCLHWGCIPAKSLLESAKVYQQVKNAEEFGVDGIDKKSLSFNWENALLHSEKAVGKLTKGIEYLLKKNGVEIIKGTAAIRKNNIVSIDGNEVTAEHIIIATGSKPKAMEEKLSHAPIVELEDLFQLKHLPENIVVTGNHISSFELAQFFKLIEKKVTLLTNSDYFMDGMDEFLISFVTKKLLSEEIELIQAKYPDRYENGNLIVDGKQIKCDLIVNCNSRKAIIPESETPFHITERGFIKTSDNFETNLPGVYAIGDVTGKSFVAHLASAQAIFVINSIKGIKGSFDKQVYPMNMYTLPEISQIGMTEKQIVAEGIAYKVSEFPLSANGKALIEGNSEGIIRMLSDKKYGQVLGVQIVAANATDMIGEASAIMSMGGTVYDVAKIIHAHPTVSEIFMEVGFNAIDKAIHI